MLTPYVFKFLLMAGCAVLIAACASGSSISSNANNGGTDNSTQRDVPWTSPAMILQDGEKSKPCTQAFTLDMLPSSQRAGKHMTSGATEITAASTATASFNAGLIAWDNLQVDGGKPPLDLRPFRYVQINAVTGAFATSSSATGSFGSISSGLAIL